MGTHLYGGSLQLSIDDDIIHKIGSFVRLFLWISLSLPQGNGDADADSNDSECCIAVIDF